MTNPATQQCVATLQPNDTIETKQNAASSKLTRWIAGIAAGISAAAAMMLLFTKVAIWVSGGVLTLFGATMAMGQQASMTAAQASRPEAEILQGAESYRQAVLKQDAGTIVAHFREDAVEMPPNQPPVTGRNAIAQFYEGSFHSPVKVTAFTFSHTEVSVHGDVAYDVGTYKRSMTTPGGPLEASGPYVVILKKTAGQWLVAYLIYNCDCPPQTNGNHANLSR